MPRDRVADFVRAWRRRFGTIPGIDVVSGVEGAKLWVEDLEALVKPRVVVRTLAKLQALPVGTMLKVQGDRAAQVDRGDVYDPASGEAVEANVLIYVGTDEYDNLTAPNADQRDTLRRMLPAIVIEPLD